MTDKNDIEFAANNPVELDLSKNMVYLTYETSKWDPSHPVRATLHLEETQGLGMRSHFNVDLLYPCICDRVTRKQHRTPPDVLSSLGELKSYVNETLKSRRTSCEIGYYRRLIQNKLLSREEFRSYQRTESGSGWGGTCPVCFDSANGTGSELIACVKCGVCKACNGNGGNVRLVPCTKCGRRWFNPRRHPRCVGRPGLLIVVNLPRGIRGRKWPSLKRTFRVPYPQHPAAIAPCGECWEEDNSEWLSCGNPACWSLNGVVCKACSPSGGVKCVGGHTWFCDECANQLPSLKCCYNREKGDEGQVGRDVEAIFGPRDYLRLGDPDDSLNPGRLQIFS